MDKIIFFKEEINDAVTWLKNMKNPPIHLTDEYKRELEKLEDTKQMGWPGEKPSENSYYSLRTCSSWTTAWVIYCITEYLMLEKDSKAISIDYLGDPVLWLIKARNNDDKDKINYGGWPDFRFDESLCESTSWAIIALTQYYALVSTTMKKEGLTHVEGVIKDGVHWLLENQNDDKGWGFWREDRRTNSSYTGGSRTYTTSFAMIALLRSLKLELDALKDYREKMDESLESGLNWLIKNSKDGCGFGEKDERNPAGTSFALLAIAEYHGSKNEKNKFKNYEKAVEYLKTEFNEYDHSWKSVFENNAVDWTEKTGLPAQTIKKHIRRNFRWDYFTTTYATIALMKFSEEGPFIHEVFKAMENLAATQMKDQKNKGAWALSKDENIPRIWCTANVLWALLMFNKYLDIYKHPDALATHYKKITSLRDEILDKFKLQNEKKLEDWLKIISDNGEPYPIPIFKKAYTTSNGLWYVAILLPLIVFMEWSIIQINVTLIGTLIKRIFILAIISVVILCFYARYQEKKNEIVLAVIILLVIGLADIVRDLLT